MAVTPILAGFPNPVGWAIDKVAGFVGGAAALTRHRDAPVHVVELGDRVRVRIDAEHAAERKGCLVPAPIQVKAPRVGIYFHRDAVSGASLYYMLIPTES